MTGSNIGFALYAIGETAGTLDARWSYENAYSGYGQATGGPNQDSSVTSTFATSLRAAISRTSTTCRSEGQATSMT
jgi:hypothetical protein